MAKHLVQLRNGKVEVVKTATAPLTWLDYVKLYYGKAIVVLGAVLAAANELTPVLNFLPGQDKHYVTVGLTVVAGLVGLLKRNQAWVENL